MVSNTKKKHCDFSQCFRRIIIDFHYKFDKFKGLVEPMDFKEFVLTGQISVFKWIYQLLTADCLFYYNSKDKKPVWAHFKHLVKKAVKKIL